MHPQYPVLSTYLEPSLQSLRHLTVRGSQRCQCRPRASQRRHCIRSSHAHSKSAVLRRPVPTRRPPGVPRASRRRPCWASLRPAFRRPASSIRRSTIEPARTPPPHHSDRYRTLRSDKGPRRQRPRQPALARRHGRLLCNDRAPPTDSPRHRYRGPLRCPRAHPTSTRCSESRSPRQIPSTRTPAPPPRQPRLSLSSHSWSMRGRSSRPSHKTSQPTTRHARQRSWHNRRSAAGTGPPSNGGGVPMPFALPFSLSPGTCGIALHAGGAEKGGVSNAGSAPGAAASA